MDVSRGPEGPRARRKKKSRMGRLPSEITGEELSMWFHVPAEEAAKAMRVSLTVLKRIARKNGITRWPYRKVKSLSRAIAQPGAGGGKAGSQNVLADVLSPTNPLDQQIAVAAMAAAAASQAGSPKELPLGRSASHAQLPRTTSGGAPGSSGMPPLPPAPLPSMADLPPLPLSWLPPPHQPQQPQPQQPQPQQAPQGQHQRQVLTDAFHPAWQQPEAAGAPSGNSQGSRLWGGPPSPMAAAKQPQQQQPKRAIPQRPIVVRPQPHAWPAWPVAPPALAPMPAPTDSAALTPTSADTRGIEVLLSAIEHEQQWEGAAQGPLGAPPAGGAPSSEGVVATLVGSVVGDALQSAELARVASEGGSAGSSTNLTSASPAQPSALQAGDSSRVLPMPLVPEAGNVGTAGELLSRLGARLRAAAALAEQTRQTPSPQPAGVRLVSIGGNAAFRPVQPQQAQQAQQAQQQQARSASPGHVWQAAGAAAAHHAQKQQLPSPFEGASPRAVSPGSSLPSKAPLGAELSLQDMAARRASGTIPVAEKQGGALGEHGSGGDSNGGGMERLPTLEWAACQGTRGNSPCPPGAPPGTATAPATRQFSFGLPLASLNAAPGGSTVDALASASSAELFGPAVRVASAVGAKRPAPAAAWEAGVAAGADDGGSPSKRARAQAAAAAATDPMASAPRAASLQGMLGMLRQAAGMQPSQEQQWEADRQQLLRLLVASVAGGNAPAALPPTPPPTNPAVGSLEALLRGRSWPQPAPVQQPSQPAPMQQLMQLLGGGEGGSGQVLAQLALIKQLHTLQQAQAQQLQAQQAHQAQQAQQAMPSMAFQGFQAAPQQQIQQQQQQQAGQQPPAGQSSSVPEPVAMMYLQRIAKKLGYNIDNIALQHQAQQQGAPQQQ